MSAISLGLCYFLLLAVLSDARGWDLGNGLNYDMTTTLMFREVTPGVNGDVGFQLTGRLVATAIWRDPSDYHSVLLKLQVDRNISFFLI